MTFISENLSKGSRMFGLPPQAGPSARRRPVIKGLWPAIRQRAKRPLLAPRQANRIAHVPSYRLCTHARYQLHACIQELSFRATAPRAGALELPWS
jgi:hypothetical protein